MMLLSPPHRERCPFSLAWRYLESLYSFNFIFLCVCACIRNSIFIVSFYFAGSILSRRVVGYMWFEVCTDPHSCYHIVYPSNYPTHILKISEFFVLFYITLSPYCHIKWAIGWLGVGMKFLHFLLCALYVHGLSHLLCRPASIHNSEVCFC